MHFTRRTPIDSLRPGPRALALATLAAAGVVSAVALTGCNIVTPVAYAIEGPGQIEAEYTLANRKTVVFVDDPTNKLPRTALRTALGDAISLDLMGREILGSTVATRDAVVASRQLGEKVRRAEQGCRSVQLKSKRMFFAKMPNALTFPQSSRLGWSPV